MTNTLLEIERDKYVRLYTSPGTAHHYGWNSHIIKQLPIIHDILDIQKDDTIIDWGCGRGWAMHYFTTMGIKTTGIDITGTGLTNEVKEMITDRRVAFYERSVWDSLDEVEPHTWSLVSLLLSQMPEDKLDATLDNIKKLTTRGVCFILTIPVDEMKPRLLPKTAGVEIEFSSWGREAWAEYLSKHFDVRLGDYVPGSPEFYYIWAQV